MIQFAYYERLHLALLHINVHWSDKDPVMGVSISVVAHLPMKCVLQVTS